MIVIVEREHRSLRLQRVGAVGRLTTRLFARRLDRQLAAGATPESTKLLAVRADALVRPTSRASLASSLERVAAVAAGRCRLSRAAVPPSRRQVLGAGGELRAVIERLRGPGPISAQGAARLRLLLTDGGGPVYRNPGHTDLARELRGALRGLDATAGRSRWAV